MKPTTWIVIGAINGLIAVGAGAFGAHALKSRLDANALSAWEVAARYQMVHALVLFVVAWLACHRPARMIFASGVAFLVGLILFCGSLYMGALGGWRWVFAITPAGGVSLMLGWLLLALAAARRGNIQTNAAP